MHSPCSLARTNGGPSVSRFISARQICWQRYRYGVSYRDNDTPPRNRRASSRQHDESYTLTHHRMQSHHMVLIWCHIQHVLYTSRQHAARKSRRRRTAHRRMSVAPSMPPPAYRHTSAALIGSQQSTLGNQTPSTSSVERSAERGVERLPRGEPRAQISAPQRHLGVISAPGRASAPIDEAPSAAASSSETARLQRRAGPSAADATRRRAAG